MSKKLQIVTTQVDFAKSGDWTPVNQLVQVFLGDATILEIQVFKGLSQTIKNHPQTAMQVTVAEINTPYVFEFLQKLVQVVHHALVDVHIDRVRQA